MVEKSKESYLLNWDQGVFARNFLVTWFRIIIQKISKVIPIHVGIYVNNPQPFNEIAEYFIVIELIIA